MDKSEDIINYIELKGFRRDIEDNVWYSKDYSKRVVPEYYCKHTYSLFYDSGGFSNGIIFKTLEELKIILKDTNG